MLSFKFKDDLWMSYMAFCSLKYPYVGKENTLEVNQCGSESETLLLSLQICGFAICGLGHEGNFRINHYKFTDLRFADGHIPEICELAIAK